jgi:alpha-tubulin suppressor-like RCC1 family protein
VDVDPPGDAVSVAAGGAHSLTVRRDKTVWAWGYNAAGQLGDNTRTARSRPIRVLAPAGAAGGPFMTGAIQVAAGWYHSLALREDGTVWAWGRNSEGQVGDGSRTSRLRPVRVVGLSNIRFIAAGVEFSAAITRDGALFTWGKNASGQLGINNRSSQSVPQRVLGASTSGAPTALSNIALVSLGGEHALALRSDGVALAWGANANGQLGLSNRTDSLVARAITQVALSGSTPVGAPRWKGVAAGFSHSLLLSSDGRVFSGGNNFFGQLGQNTTSDQLTLRPVQAAPGSGGTLSGISAISAGSGHSLALSGTTLRAWGWNAFGTLGDGTRVNRGAPIVVPNTGPVRAFSGGYAHTLAAR